MKKRGNKILLRLGIFKKKNKGLSTIVVTLIIILLSLVAVGIVWVVVRNIINTGSNQINLGQFTIDLTIKNAYEQNGNIIVDVKRNAGTGELAKIKFILSDGTSSEIITKDSSLGELEEANFIIYPTQLVPSEIETVSIVPVFLANDGSETIGEVSSTYNLASGQVTNPNEETGGGSENNSSCTPDCTGLQCGSDPICGQSCGTCSGTDTCSQSGICVPLACVPNSNATTCGTAVCGVKVNNCGQYVTCGNCSSGQVCSSGSCIIPTPINTGTVQETWPGTSSMYFGSSNLPTDISYQGYYISFPGSAETSCRLIVFYFFPPSEGYSKSHIGFNSATLIATGNSYKIWRNSNECQATLS